MTVAAAALGLSTELQAASAGTVWHGALLGRRVMQLPDRLLTAGSSPQAPMLVDMRASVSTQSVPSPSRAPETPLFGTDQPTPYVHAYFVVKNEQVLLPLAIQHYRTRFPGCRITIFDNNSTDETVRIAQRAGCEVIHWETRDNIIDEVRLAHLKGVCWRTDNVTGKDPPWVIVADLDEWLDMWQEDLQAEDAKGAVVIKTTGVGLVGNSSSPTLADIDVHSLTSGNYQKMYSKLICFKRGPNGIKGIAYREGAHTAVLDPADARLSSSCYVLKHMSVLGLPYFENKLVHRYWQSVNSRKMGFDIHYTKDAQAIRKLYIRLRQSATHFPYEFSASGHSRLQCVD